MENRFKKRPQERPDVFSKDIDTFSKQLHFFRYSIVKKYALGKLLDIGCGIGNLYKVLGERIEYFGIDISKEAIDKARAVYDNDSKFKTYNGINIPFDDNYFDTVSSLEVIEHLDKDNHIKHLQEIIRVTKPRGIIIISTPNRNYPIKFIKKIFFKWNNPFHKYEYKRCEFIYFLKSHSLKITKKFYIGDPLNFFGNFLIQKIFRSKPKVKESLFKCGLIINKLLKNFCNDVLVVCKKEN